MALLRIARDTASEAQIMSHLQSCSQDFVPPLDDLVDITVYAHKLRSRANTYEAWCGNQLAGLVALYLNGDSSCGFITSVSVKRPQRGQGLARALLLDALNHAEALGYDSVSLEVDEMNAEALRLYYSLGFYLIDSKSKTARMTLTLGKSLGTEVRLGNR